MLTEILLKNWRDRTTFERMRVKSLPVINQRAPTLFLCPSCGWCGTMFEAHHFTIGDIEALLSVLKDKSRKIVSEWHKNICPICNDFNLIPTQDEPITTKSVYNNIVDNLLRHY